MVLACNSATLEYDVNFSASLSKTSGDLVFLSDQDDVWFPDKIERFVAVVESNPHELVVMNNADLTDADMNGGGLTKIGQICSADLYESSLNRSICLRLALSTRFLV